MGLIINRRVGEGIVLEVNGERCRIFILSTDRRGARLGIEGDPQLVRVLRDEIVGRYEPKGVRR